MTKKYFLRIGMPIAGFALTFMGAYRFFAGDPDWYRLLDILSIITGLIIFNWNFSNMVFLIYGGMLIGGLLSFYRYLYMGYAHHRFSHEIYMDRAKIGLLFLIPVIMAFIIGSMPDKEERI